jgi:hypothetical protein
MALTPLTTKYFVFISSAFREKSAVLFRCIPDHAKAEDVFHEFSNICTTPFKSFDCNKNMSMRHLMQYLNGAALASIWVFFEHIDKLNYINLQTFNKEIQMVQQQFIIAELSQDSSVITAHITVGNHSHSQAQRSIEQRFNPQRNALNPDDDVPHRQQDIRIEDNFGGGLNHEEEVSDEEDVIQYPSERKQNKGVKEKREGRNEEVKRDLREKENEGKLKERMRREKLKEISGDSEDRDEGKLNFDGFKGRKKIEHERSLDSESEGDVFGSEGLEGFKMGMEKELLEDMLKEEEEEHHEDKQMYEQRRSGSHSKHNRESSKEEHKNRKRDNAESNESKTDRTGGDDASKMNKICFGVFASISHEFILANSHKADEISLYLQSAFRVISLTRPEYKVILKTLLK